jgi:hypothetical protein
MKKSKPWLLVAVLGTLFTFMACASRGTPLPLMPIPAAVEYGVEQTVTLVNDGPGVAIHILLRVALIRDIEPYQEVVSMKIAPQDFETITDEYGNLYAKFEFEDVAPGGERSIEIRYQVAVNELDFDLGNCEGLLPGIFVHSEQWIESDAERIAALAEELAEGKDTVC